MPPPMCLSSVEGATFRSPLNERMGTEIMIMEEAEHCMTFKGYKERHNFGGSGALFHPYIKS